MGDTFDVTVTFPDGYGDSTDAEGNTITLSGKEAVFSVTLNSISESGAGDAGADRRVGGLQLWHQR